MYRKIFVALTIVCCTVFFSHLKGSEVGDVWVAQKSDRGSDRYFTATECYINPGEERTLAFDLPGTIDFVAPEEGHTITSDQIVAGLRAEVAAAEEKVAEIRAKNMTGIKFAEKSLDVAKAELKKAKLTNEQKEGTISDIELLRLELELEKSELSVTKAKDEKKIAELEWNQAKAKLSTYGITGRIDGVVTKIFKKPGEAVRQGDPVLAIINTKRVKIEGHLPFFEAEQVKPGALVFAKLLLSADEAKKFKNSEKEYRGTVIFVDRKAGRTTSNIAFKAEFDNSDGTLIPGLMTTLKVYPDRPGPEVPRRKKPAITAIQD